MAASANGRLEELEELELDEDEEKLVELRPRIQLAPLFSATNPGRLLAAGTSQRQG
jgi:hypothetical protein